MMKNMTVATPEKKIAVLTGNPMSRGATTVAPNIASACCRPSAIVLPQGSRSSGAITPDDFTRQLSMKLLPLLSLSLCCPMKAAPKRAVRLAPSALLTKTATAHKTFQMPVGVCRTYHEYRRAVCCHPRLEKQKTPHGPHKRGTGAILCARQIF